MQRTSVCNPTVRRIVAFARVYQCVNEQKQHQLHCHPFAIVCITCVFSVFPPPQGRVKRVKKFAAVKRIIGKNDSRLKANKKDVQVKKKGPDMFEGKVVRQVTKMPSHLFFKYNNSLGPPYRILVDTNFINFSIQVRRRVSCMQRELNECTAGSTCV